MAHRFFTDQTPSGIESRCNQLDVQGWLPVSSGFSNGFYHVHLYREEDWSLPFRAACRSEAQSALVLAIRTEVPESAQRYPLREWGWGITQVTDYLAERGIEIPQRTDCDRCFFQSIAEWYLLWKRHPERYEEAAAQERKTGHTWRNPSRDTWSAGLDDLRREFEIGRKIPNLERHLQLRITTSDRTDMCRVCKL